MSNKKVLVFDIGNTNVKAAVFSGDDMLLSFRLETSPRTSDEYAILFVQMLSQKGISKSEIGFVVISSVNPRLNYTFIRVCEYLFNVRPLMVDAASARLKTSYLSPAQLGADRIASAVAAIKLYGAPAIVVDFGTATVFNAITKEGEFLGGSIFVGIKSAMDSLVEKTALINEVELEFPRQSIGRSTAENLTSGFVFGFIGALEYIIGKFKEDERMAHAKVIATGGLSELIKKGTTAIDIFDRALSLKGLNEIYKLNQK